MSAKSFHQFFKVVVLFIFGFLDLTLLIRILLKFIGASTESSFVEFWYKLTNTFYSPFSGTFSDITADKVVFELDTVLAIAVYFCFALLFLKLINSIFARTFISKLSSSVDTFFKFIEVFLIIRLILKLLGAGTSSFYTFINNFTSVIHEPFDNILRDISSGTVVLELSTLIAIIIFFIIDFFSDKLFSEIASSNVTNSHNEPKLPQMQQGMPFIPSRDPNPNVFQPGQSTTIQEFYSGSPFSPGNNAQGPQPQNPPMNTTN